MPAAALPKRTLGRTGLEVTALGFGSAPLGDIYEVLDDKTAIGTVETAAENGVTLFDTHPSTARAALSTASARRFAGSPPAVFCFPPRSAAV